MSAEPSKPAESWLNRNGLPLLLVLATLAVGVWALTHPPTPEQRAAEAARSAEDWRAMVAFIGPIWSRWWVRLIPWVLFSISFSEAPRSTNWRAERLHDHRDRTPQDSLGCSLIVFSLVGFVILEAAGVDPMRWPYLVLSAMLIAGPSMFASAAIDNLGSVIRRQSSPGEHGW